jgi:hypothetical protein
MMTEKTVTATEKTVTAEHHWKTGFIRIVERLTLYQYKDTVERLTSYQYKNTVERLTLYQYENTVERLTLYQYKDIFHKIFILLTPLSSSSTFCLLIFLSSYLLIFLPLYLFITVQPDDLIHLIHNKLSWLFSLITYFLTYYSKVF